MRSTPLFVLAAGILVFVGAPEEARADGTCAPVTWGSRTVSTSEPATASGSPVTRARDLLTRAKSLDEAAAADDKASVDLQQRLPALRATAKAARERSTHATGAEQELLVAIAEDLETEVIVSEAETVAKRRHAVENRQAARELRAKAVKLVREAPTDLSEEAGTKCDPPWRFTADGRKTYLFECLK